MLDYQCTKIQQRPSVVFQSFVCLVGFLTFSSTNRLTILHAATHETERGDHDLSEPVTFILTPTQTVRVPVDLSRHTSPTKSPMNVVVDSTLNKQVGVEPGSGITVLAFMLCVLWVGLNMSSSQ